jgi:AhpD family alkylhydroperoxidase
MTNVLRHMTYDTFSKTAAPVQEALLALGKCVDDSGLEKTLTELVKLRAAQMNGCAFCVQLHLNVARRLGVPVEKLDLVSVWREAGVFTARERAALAWTEVLTDLTRDAARSEAEAQVAEAFTEEEALYLTVTIGTINQWNRIAVALRFPPPILKHAQRGAA